MFQSKSLLVQLFTHTTFSICLASTSHPSSAWWNHTHSSETHLSSAVSLYYFFFWLLWGIIDSLYFLVCRNCLFSFSEYFHILYFYTIPCVPPWNDCISEHILYFLSPINSFRSSVKYSTHLLSYFCILRAQRILKNMDFPLKELIFQQKKRILLTSV